MKMNRRNFMQSGLAVGAGVMLAQTLTSRAQQSTPSKDINVALVGVGAQGKALLNAALMGEQIPNVRYKAVCDIWEFGRTYGERFLKKYNHDAKPYTDYEEMLAKEKDLDAVIVATPDFWHAPITCAALKAGKHVYCEKMMSNTIEGARSMVRAMKETGKLLQIGHQRRSNPRYIYALDILLKQCKIAGRLTNANAQWNRAVSEDLGWPEKYVIPDDVLKKYGYENMMQFRNWRWFKKYSGGPISDLGAHQIDIFNWYFGTTPKSILAGGGKDYYKTHEWYDNVMVIFEYERPEGNVRAFYEVLTTTSAGGGYWEQFMGDEGAVKMSENPKLTKIFREERAPDWAKYVEQKILGTAAAPPPKADSGAVDVRESKDLVAFELPVELKVLPHRPHLENFFNAIRGKGKLTCPADEAFHSEASILKINEAVEAKTMITLKPEDFAV